MSRTNEQIRALLRTACDGLTVNEICGELEISGVVARKVLSKMPDAYIDRWLVQAAGAPAAVWCVVVPPPNCPRPRKKLE